MCSLTTRSHLWSLVPLGPLGDRWERAPELSTKGLESSSTDLIPYDSGPRAPGGTPGERQRGGAGGLTGRRLPCPETAGERGGESCIRGNTNREGNNLFSAFCLIECFSESTCNVRNQQIWI